MVKDFDHFMDRRPLELDTSSSKANKIFSEVLTSLTGDKWKTMRSTLSPVFTSGKLKHMSAIINQVLYRILYNS